MSNRLLGWIKKKTTKTRGVEGIPPPDLPTHRPRPLTPSATRESLLISVAAATAESDFFQKLPFEIRHKILLHAFGGNVLHLGICFMPPRVPPSHKPPRGLRPGGIQLQLRLESFVCISPDSPRTSTHNEYHKGSGPWCTCKAKGEGICYIGIMGWLLSCRQA